MTDPKISTIAIVILAAGKSERLGSPKQLLSFNGENLLRHSVDAALATGCQSVFVILGANSELLRKELIDKSVSIIENTEWPEGMASSIRCALENITDRIISIDSVIFMVCDQPFVSSNLLLALVFGLLYRLVRPMSIDSLSSMSVAMLIVAQVCRTAVFLNLLLMFFNFIPIPPLDGSKILAALWPDVGEKWLQFMAQYQMFVMAAIFLAGGTFISAIIGPPVRALGALILGAG